MKKTELILQKDKTAPIDDRIFGNFIEHIENCILGGLCDAGNPLSDENGIRMDVLEKCKALAPTVLRFPGGTVMGIYHWEEHIGPVEQRRKRRNIVWGNRMCHEFGTAEFVQYCRAIGAEPMICVNMPTGSAEEAANWVEYCNGTEDTYYANLRRSHGYEEPFNVKYWCVGNESYAEPDLGIQHDVNIYIRDAWEFTKYMKMTDPTIELVYVGHNEEWNRRVLDSLGCVCDYLSLHFYANTGDDPERPWKQLEDYVRDTLKPAENLITEVNAREEEFNVWYRIPQRKGDIKIALDEWNIWNTAPNGKSKYGLIQDYTWRDALWVGSFLNLLINHCGSIGIANMAQMVNVIAPIMAEKDGSYFQTTFYPMQYYRKMAGSERIHATCEGLDVCVTKQESTCIAFIVNKEEEDMQVALPAELAEAVRMTADAPDAINTLTYDAVHIETVTGRGEQAFIVPANSICILKM